MKDDDLVTILPEISDELVEKITPLGGFMLPAETLTDAMQPRPWTKDQEKHLDAMLEVINAAIKAEGNVVVVNMLFGFLDSLAEDWDGEKIAQGATVLLHKQLMRRQAMVQAKRSTKQ